MISVVSIQVDSLTDFIFGTVLVIHVFPLPLVLFEIFGSMRFTDKLVRIQIEDGNNDQVILLPKFGLTLGVYQALQTLDENFNGHVNC